MLRPLLQIGDIGPTQLFPGGSVLGYQEAVKEKQKTYQEAKSPNDRHSSNDQPVILQNTDQSVHLSDAISQDVEAPVEDDRLE